MVPLLKDRKKKEALTAKFEAEKKSLAELAAAAPSRGIWARPAPVVRRDCAAACASAPEGSKLIDVLSMLGSPKDFDYEPASDSEVSAALDALETRRIAGAAYGSGGQPPDPAALAVDGQNTEGHPSVSVF